jgi:hypothetical protein
MQSNHGARELIETVVSEGSYNTVSRADLLNEVASSGSLERAKVRADQFAAAASCALSELPKSEYVEALHAIPAYVLNRDH